MSNRTALVVIVTDNPGGAERIACIFANRLATIPGWSVELEVVCQRSSEFVASNTHEEVLIKFGTFSRERLAFAAFFLGLIGRRYDLVFTTHVHTNALTSAMRKSGLLSTRQLVSRESTTIFDRFTGLKRAIFRGLYRLYGGQDLIIAQTRYMAEHVTPYLPSHVRGNVQVLPNPIDLTAIEREAAASLPDAIARTLSGRDNIIFCGRLIDVKQPLLAVQAYAGLVAALPPAQRPRLVFMGDGPLRASVEMQAREAGLTADDVVCLGRQTNPYAIMRLCRYGLLTSSREGFPNVVLEMMASGVRKVVVTPCAGDLDALIGVTVTPDFQAGTLTAALLDAVETGEDRREDYRGVVADRSIGRFVDDILGACAIAASPGTGR